MEGWQKDECVRVFGEGEDLTSTYTHICLGKRKVLGMKNI